MNKKAIGLTPEEKRTRDIRNGVLLAHVVISWVVVIAVRFKWWTVVARGEPVGDFFGNDPHAFQTGYITLAAIAAFFFTSYDIVTNSDIQWPPLLASAFALGCAAQVTWKLNVEKDVVLQHVIAAQTAKDLAEDEERSVADVGSASAAAVSSAVAAVSSSARERPDRSIRVRLGTGLLLTLFGTFSMVLLSSYLTFFLRRDGPP